MAMEEEQAHSQQQQKQQNDKKMPLWLVVSIVIHDFQSQRYTSVATLYQQQNQNTLSEESNTTKKKIIRKIKNYFFTIFITLIDIVYFIVTLASHGFERPSVNPMLGPSADTLMAYGANVPYLLRTYFPTNPDKM